MGSWKHLLAYPLSASQIGKSSHQKLGWLAVKSVIGLKNSRMWIALCDNTFQSKLVFAHIWSLRHRAWGLVLICKAVLEPSRRTQR